MSKYDNLGVTQTPESGNVPSKSGVIKNSTRKWIDRGVQVQPDEYSLSFGNDVVDGKKIPVHHSGELTNDRYYFRNDQCSNRSLKTIIPYHVISNTMDEHTRHFEFLLLLDEMRELDEETAIIVEGKKDEAVLEKLNINAPAFLLKSHGGLVDVAEAVAKEFPTIIVLTDWDRTGGRLAHRVSDILEGWNVDVDMDYRKRFARLTGKEIRTVEGLVKYMYRALEDEIAVRMYNEKKSI